MSSNVRLILKDFNAMISCLLGNRAFNIQILNPYEISIVFFRKKMSIIIANIDYWINLEFNYNFFVDCKNTNFP